MTITTKNVLITERVMLLVNCMIGDSERNTQYDYSDDYGSHDLHDYIFIFRKSVLL